MGHRVKICFFAAVKDRLILERVDFYRQDIEILGELGYKVTIATSWHEIPYDADIYFVWWWTRAWLPMLKAALRRRPVVVTGTFDFHWRGEARGDYFARPFWQRALMSASCHMARVNVFVSSQEWVNIRRSFRLTNACYSPHTVRTDEFKPDGGERDDFVLSIAWSGELNAWRKCLPELLCAMSIIHASHPTVRFVIAGERGGYYPQLERLARELGVDSILEFPGVISESEKLRLLQRAKVYLQPSRYEGFGLAILEAMSCGTPVVSSPVGAVPEVVGQAGILVDGSKPEAIAAAAKTLLDNAEMRTALGEQARRRAQALFPRARRKHELGRILADVLNGKHVDLPEWSEGSCASDQGSQEDGGTSEVPGL